MSRKVIIEWTRDGSGCVNIAAELDFAAGAALVLAWTPDNTWAVASPVIAVRRRVVDEGTDLAVRRPATAEEIEEVSRVFWEAFG